MIRVTFDVSSFPRHNNPYPTFTFPDLTSGNPSSPAHMSSTHGMSDPSELEPQTLQTLLDDAIKQYENKVGTSLIENQVAIELGPCDSIESITQVLEERAQAFRNFLGRDRHPKIIKSIKRAVHVLHAIVTASSVLGGGAAQVGHGAGSVVRPTAMILSA
jgi:hypothetical protein